MNEIHKCPAVRVGMFPKDTNATGTNIFGGVILSHMDIAGAIAAQEVTDHRVFTVSFDKVVFKQPVHIGDVLTCWSEVTRIGRTSITTHIRVEAQRKGVFIPVTEGEAVYVAVDDDGHPIPVKSKAVASSAARTYGKGCHHDVVTAPVSAPQRSDKQDKRVAKTVKHSGKTDKRSSKTDKQAEVPAQKCPAIRIGMMPKDTSAMGTNIFAGVILSHMDTAGVIATRDVTNHRVVTVSFDKVDFKQPVHVGDVLTCFSEVIKVGRTSITTRITVLAQRKGVFIPVTEGEAVYVSVDPQGKPIPVKDQGTSTPIVGASNCGPTCSSTGSASAKTEKKQKHKKGKKKSKK
jgi:acyl-CoA thioesterase YciA